MKATHHPLAFADEKPAQRARGGCGHRRGTAGPKAKLQCSTGMPPSQTWQPPVPDLPPRASRRGFCQTASACKGMLPWKCGEEDFSQHRMLCCANASAAEAGGAAAVPGRCLPVRRGSWELREGDIPRGGHSKALHGRRKPPQTTQTGSRSHPQIFRWAPKPLENQERASRSDCIFMVLCS